MQRVEDGWTQRGAAAALGAHPVTVARWVARFRGEGEEGSAAEPTPGRPRFLTAEQEKTVLGWLADPPTRHGLRTDLWTARRVAELIRTKLKVEFHPHYLREWLRERDFTPQKPARRAPEVFNTDRGVQFTAQAWTDRLEGAGVRVSMGGRGRAADNVFVERLWRAVKYEDVYLRGYESVPDLERGLAAYFVFYNGERLHQSLGYRTPAEVYAGGRRTAGEE